MTSPGRLLPVVLDDGLGSRCGGVGVFAELASGAALAEQVPALVEFHLDLAQLFEGGLLAAACVPRWLAAERVLLVHEFGDPSQDGVVVHESTSEVSAAICSRSAS